MQTTKEPTKLVCPRVRVRLVLAMLCSVACAGTVSAAAASAAVTWSANITGSGTAALNSPEGVAMDGSNIVVADAGNHRLEVFSPDGKVQSFSSTAALSEPRQAVLVGSDFIVSDHGTNKVEKINASTGADDGSFGTPPGGWYGNTEVATNGDQSLVAVANTYNQSVDLFTSSGTFVRELTSTGGSPSSLSYPEGVGFDASNNVWVADTQNHRVVEFSGRDGSFVRAWSYTEISGSFYPTAVSIDQRTGELWVADWQHNQAIEFDPSGNVQNSVSTAGGTNPLEGPLTVALDPATGDLYVASEYGNEIVRYTGAGSTGAPPAQAPTVTTTAADGITETAATLHGTVNPNGGTITKCEFLWGTDLNYRSTPVPCAETVGSGTSSVSVSARITGLTAGQTYHFALLAKNGAGSTGGNDEQVVAGAPPAAATNNASSIDAHDLVINGAITDTGGLDTHYYFQWGPDLDHMPNDTPDTDIGTSPGSASAVLHNLQPFTQYCFRLIAYNALGVTYAHDAGSGDPGTNRGKCVSTNGGPIPTVTTSTPQPGDAFVNRIELHGSIETPSGTSSTAYFQISTYPDVAYATTVPVTQPTSQSPLPWADDAPHIVGATATGLSPGTTYYWRLVGSSRGGQDYGHIVQGSTAPAQLAISVRYLDHSQWLDFATNPPGTPFDSSRSGVPVQFACSLNGQGAGIDIQYCGMTITDDKGHRYGPYQSGTSVPDLPTKCDGSKQCNYSIAVHALDDYLDTKDVTYSYSVNPRKTAPPPSYAALGDSYASGEGTGDYLYPSDLRNNRCHRSPHAFPELLDSSRSLGPLTFVACSGAITDDLVHPNNEGQIDPKTGSPEPAQFDALDRTTTVTLTIGGNDVGFTEIAKHCLVAKWGFITVYGSAGCAQDQTFTSEIKRRVTALAGGGQATTPGGTSIHSFASLLNTAHDDAPNAHIYLAGYPRFFPALTSSCSVGTVHGSLGGTTLDLAMYISADDARWLNSVETELNDAMKQAVKAAPASWHARFVDPDRAFASHRFCDSSASWINPLSANADFKTKQLTSTDPGSFHPNVDGQNAYASAFRGSGI